MRVRHRYPRRRRVYALGAALLALLALSGCANLPESTAPQALGTINRQPTSDGPPPPLQGRDPDLLLRDFLVASADPANKHLIARQFMTPEASTHWDDTSSTVIVEKPDTLRESRTGDKATYVIRARTVGELSADGAYRAVSDPFEKKIEMTKVDGEWRIDDPPDGVVMDSTAFAKFYRRYVLYFVDPTGTTLVPDLRWIAVPNGQLTQRLLALLNAGTQPALTPVLRNELAAPVAIHGPITKANGDAEDVGIGLGGVHIDFSGAAGLAPHDRELLAAQVVLTLSGAGILGPYQISVDGKPLDERYAANGYTVADVEAFSPATGAQNKIGLHALRGGGLVQVEPNGSITPTPGYFGAVNNLQSVALSPDGQLVAAVAATGRPAPDPAQTLMIGSYGGSAFPVVEGGSISRPSWNSDGTAAWVVVDGERVIRVVNDRATGTVSRQDVDISALTNANSSLRLPITELRVSRTGVRAALVADGKVYVAVIERHPDGTYALTSPLPIGVTLSTRAVSLSWLTPDTIAIAREGNVDPVSTVSIDGSQLVPQTARNLTPPVRLVDGSGDHEYAADARAVLELASAPDVGDAYWRELPNLGANAVPVLPG
ncbi:MtrAB system accessory lipoprotein LpqB [Nocardia arthritidis]|uniref:Lipoprotein LpqB n=1 Tax=Nocardia arthritidis TaxID=228602 RepID=A0A6G9YPX0_9NOCA|nr:MtrAB system accessory protein LpqB [Nocardia arthritidis]